MKELSLNVNRKNPLMVPVFIAQEKGIFEKYDLKVNLDVSEDFQFGGNSPFYEGKSDAMVGDITFFFYMLEKGKKAIVTSDLTRTIHLVGKNLPNDYRGLKIGVNRAGLFRLLLENDLKEVVPEPEIVWLNNSYERIQALEEGKIHALVAIEPFISDIVEDGGEIIWSMKNSDKNLVMWAFDEEYYLNNKEAVRDFHKALEEAGMIFNNASKDEKVQLCIECAGYSKEVAKKMKDFEFEKQSNFSLKDFDLCQEWMYREKEISKLYDGKKLIGNIIE